MKRISRMLVFSGVALFVTTYFDRGFIIKPGWQSFLILAFLIALIYYLIVPLSKIVLLPVNILTMGLFSGILYILLIYGLDHYFGLIHIKEWIFPGVKISSFVIPKMHLGYLQNLLLSSYLLSVIINLLELTI